jgi:hypothetical protein
MSCLFHSLSRFVEDDSYSIRSKICDFLEKDDVLFDDVKSSQVTNWDNGKDLKSYVRDMRSTSEWGGGIEIKAFCEIYNKNVEVFKNNKCIASFSSSKDSADTICLTWTGNHYEPIVQKPEPPPTVWPIAWNQKANRRANMRFVKK